MRYACWITKATDTHSEYVMFVAFPLQEIMHKGASLLLYMYIVCFVYYAVQYLLFIMVCSTYCLLCCAALIVWCVFETWYLSNIKKSTFSAFGAENALMILDNRLKK